MSAFAKWYLAKLQSHPLATNLGSAFILMSAGDVMAQQIEASGHESVPPNDPLQRKLSFRRYGTERTALRCGTADNEPPSRVRLLSLDALLRVDQDEEFIVSSPVEISAPTSLIRHALAHANSLDTTRTGTMAFWAVAAYTPFYMGLYRLFDTYLPRRITPLNVTTRVGLSFLTSVPVNAAFYTYGTFVHQLMEWLALVQEWNHDFDQMQPGQVQPSVRDIVREVPFDFDMAWSAARLKLATELQKTVMASATVWIPINLINFSVVPPHCRPLTLMVCSAFWNCYLSLSQHRDADLS